MDCIFIFGHQNPDTDSITSALAYAHLKMKINVKVLPVRLGVLNPETIFVLNYFGIEAPKLKTTGFKGKQVILVDHNEFSQSAEDIEGATILEVIDHHRIANFHTQGPLYYRAEPVGCTATILYKLYKEKSVEIPKKIAGLMLSAILSDTLLLKSPTTTLEDISIAKKLAAIAGLDMENYGLEMLKAGTNLDSYSAKELIKLDAKNFSLHNKKVIVAQINTVSIEDNLKRKAEIMSEIQQKVSSDALGLFAFIITDILNGNSQAIVLGEQKHWFETAFNLPLENDEVFLKGIISRKKQIIPRLTKAVENCHA